MKSIFRIGFFGLLQIALGALIGIYIESVGAGRLLFFDKIFLPEINKVILDNEVIVISTLMLFNLVVFIVIDRKQNKKIYKAIYQNICHKIFAEFVEKSEILHNNNFRVGFYTVKRGPYIVKERYYIPAYGPYLKAVAMFETKQDVKYKDYIYLPKEGWMGLCYRTATIINKQISKYSLENCDSYFQECKDEFALPKRKINSLEDKPCSFLCFPITYYNTHQVTAVIAIECFERNRLKHIDVRELESVISSYSAIFQLN